MKEYKSFCKEKCLQCWAINICSSCYKDAYSDSMEGIDIIKFKSNCSSEKQVKKQLLIDYCNVLEKDEHLLDHLYNYIIAI